VWWVRAEQPATLVGDLADLAITLGLADPEEAGQQLAVAAVRRWLEDHDRWLLVLDNAGAPDMSTGLEVLLTRLVDLLPQVPHGQVLVTSRDASWEEYAAVAELEVFTPEEATAFLLARSAASDEQAAVQIAALLGWLPLALEQAGAYVRQTRLPLATYLDRLRQFPALTMAKGRPRDRDPRDTIATTWQVSLEQVLPVPGAAAMLEVCAFLGPEEIPRGLFAQHLEPRPEALAELSDDPFALDEAIAALRRYALVKADEQALTVHRLLQQVIRDQANPHQAGQWATAALRMLRAAFPSEHRNPSVWPTYARLLPHALAVTGHAESLDIEPELTAWLLNQAGLYVRQRGAYQHARLLQARALAICEAHLGPDHPDTARSLQDLAMVLYDQGDLDTARALYERALAIREASLRPDHPDIAWSLHGLALVLRAQGDLDPARILHERALAIRESRLGPDHPETARSLANLGSILADQGDLPAALALHERALAIREARLGPDHPDTAWSLYSLAVALHAQGSLEDARMMHERALAIREAHLGSEHPNTARSLNQIATVLADQGNLDGARALHERALAIREARLGADHPDTLRSREALAAVIAALDKQQ